MARQHDEGFRVFVVARWPSLVTTAYLVTGDTGIAEDCVQEALTRVHRHWRRLRLDGDPEAYARRAVVNAALSWRRRRRVIEVPLAAAGEPRARPEPEQTLDAQLIAATPSAAADASRCGAALCRGPLGGRDRRAAVLLHRQCQEHRTSRTGSTAPQP